MSVQVLKVDWPFNAEPPKMYCPVCGTRLDEEEGKYCEHVDFIFLPEVDDFHHVSAEFQPIVDGIRKVIEDAEEDSDDELASIHDKLLEMDDLGTNVLIEMTTSGMACGPTSFTVLYGFGLYKESSND